MSLLPVNTVLGNVLLFGSSFHPLDVCRLVRHELLSLSILCVPYGVLTWLLLTASAFRNPFLGE